MKKIDNADDTIHSFLQEHPLVKFDATIRRDRVRWRLDRLLPKDLPPIWLDMISWFTDDTPRNYWDIETVELSLQLLEADVERSVEAIKNRSDRLEFVFRNLCTLPTSTYDDASVGFMDPSTSGRLTENFHPDYLICAEHIFGHLISVYCGVTVRRPGKSKFDLGSSVRQLAEAGYKRLVDGYDDRIRNAVAHGQILFSANGVIYGQYEGVDESPPWEVAQKFDHLWRTCTGLTLGLLLFFSLRQAETITILPVYLKCLLSTKTLEHEGMKIQGFSESTIADIGDRLHISIKVTAKTRFEALHEVSLISYRLAKEDLVQYSRYVFEVDSGVVPAGLVTINSQILKKLISEDAKFTRFREAIEDPILLWHDEGPTKSRIQSYRESISAIVRQTTHSLFKDLREKQNIGEWTDFSIRGIENKSVSGVVRIQVSAVIAEHVQEFDENKLKNICIAIIRFFRLKIFDSAVSELERKHHRISLPGWPSYVWVSLYRRNGTLRWIKERVAGNFLVAAEWHKASARPISIRQPDLLEGNYRFLFRKDEKPDLSSEHSEDE